MGATPLPPSGPLARAWARLLETTTHEVDHDEVLAHVYAVGAPSTRYVIMTSLAAALAMLGLLMPSQAVLIGAMLLSPLMGPIILLGFSFWMVDWRSTRRALAGIVIGFVIALVLSILITWISPLKEPTSEILARARPTLFDLLVAIFSGLAGGYAIIKQRGETAIGVALAISLMPPITTVGFGIGIGAWSIAGSALLLFATNLVATVLAAALIAAVYGFKPHYHLRDRGWMSHVAVLAVLIALCVPLTLSLQSIALEGRATSGVRTAIRQIFGEKARIASLGVRSVHGMLTVDALVATPAIVPDASERLDRQLHRLTANVRVSLDQLVIGDPSRLAAPDAQTASEASNAMRRGLAQAVPFLTDMIAFDGETGRGLVLLKADSGLDLAAAMALEAGLRKRADYSEVMVVPPIQPLPPIEVSFPAEGPPAWGQQLAIDRWALRRWRAAGITATLCSRMAERNVAAVRQELASSASVRVRRDPALCRPGTSSRILLSID